MKEISYESLNLNPMTMVGHDWWLVGAGNEKDGYNAMTVAWGHLGAIWEYPGRRPYCGQPTAAIYIYPTRYTKEFIDREKIFTISVFPEEYKKALFYLGNNSGRDGDKIAAAGLTPVFTDGTVCFNEAKLTLICRKIYHAPIIEEGFVDQVIIEENYPSRTQFHEMYIGEIIKVLSAE